MLKTFILLALVLTSANGFAYTFTGDFEKGFYWASFPVGLKILASSTQEGQELLSLTQSAVSHWEAQSQRNIWQVSSNVQLGGHNEGNTIRWSYNFAEETGFDSTSTLAITTRFSQGTHIYKTVIILNGENENLRENKNNLLWSTILHEVGHTVGLDHSESFYPVMAAFANNTTSLQQDDIAGMEALVNETVYRQEVGYVSPHSSLESKEDNLLGSCGTITDVSKNIQNFNNFTMSLLLGLISLAFCLGILRTFAKSISSVSKLLPS